MKKTNNSANTRNNAVSEMRPGYHFDYSKARPNRFAEAVSKDSITIVLDPDVAEVFTTSEAVNNALRTILSAVPGT